MQLPLKCLQTQNGNVKWGLVEDRGEEHRLKIYCSLKNRWLRIHNGKGHPQALSQKLLFPHKVSIFSNMSNEECISAWFTARWQRKFSNSELPLVSNEEENSDSKTDFGFLIKSVHQCPNFSCEFYRSHLSHRKDHHIQHLSCVCMSFCFNHKTVNTATQKQPWVTSHQNTNMRSQKPWISCSKQQCSHKKRSKVGTIISWRYAFKLWYSHRRGGFRTCIFC